MTPPPRKPRLPILTTFSMFAPFRLQLTRSLHLRDGSYTYLSASPEGPSTWSRLDNSRSLCPKEDLAQCRNVDIPSFRTLHLSSRHMGSLPARSQRLEGPRICHGARPYMPQWKHSRQPPLSEPCGDPGNTRKTARALGVRLHTVVARAWKDQLRTVSS
ncbi:uncharacterized protein GJ701_017285 [Geothlypis trichas]